LLFRSKQKYIKKAKTYHFHNEWEMQYFFTMVNSNCLCLICKASLAIPKKGNIERHYLSLHKKYNEDFPPDSELRKSKLLTLKKGLNEQQKALTKLVSKPISVTIASLKITHILAKAKKSFVDGEIIKESFLAAAETLFSDFPCKKDILTNIQDLQLSRSTVTRRVEVLSENVNTKLISDIQRCHYFSLQLDESNDFTKTAQLMVFIRIVFENFSVKEELLKIIPLVGRTTGKDIFLAFDEFMEKSDLPISKLVAITTDGAPAMVGSKSGFISFCKKSEKYPTFLTYHCIIHQLVLCSKRLNTKNVMDITFKIVNSIRGKALQRRLFKLQIENEDKELLLFNNVRWLSTSQFLSRFLLLIDEIRNFLHDIGDIYPQLQDPIWLMDLSFLADFCTKLSNLNLELQGKNKSLIYMLSSIRGFQQYLGILSNNLAAREFRHFPHLLKFFNENPELMEQDLEKYEMEIDKVSNEMTFRFKDLHEMELIITFINNPFQENLNVTEISSKISNLLTVNQAEVDLEIINLQNDLALKALNGEIVWKFTSKNFPLLTMVSKKIFSCFGSTYLSESAFSAMNLIKSNWRNQITNEHLDNSLRLGLSSYEPDYEAIAKSKQCQVSH